MIKAIFFDIDGTLASFKTHQIPLQTFDALTKLQEKGIKLFIATGRGKDGLFVLNNFPFDGYITLNGQYCYTKDELIYENTICLLYTSNKEAAPSHVFKAIFPLKPSVTMTSTSPSKISLPSIFPTKSMLSFWDKSWYVCWWTSLPFFSSVPIFNNATVGFAITLIFHA